MHSYRGRGGDGERNFQGPSAIFRGGYARRYRLVREPMARDELDCLLLFRALGIHGS